MLSLHEQLSTESPRIAPLSPSIGAIPTGPAIDLSAELHREQKRLEVVTAILGGWIWETDADHRFTYMSPSVERYAGKPASWHYGKTRQELGNMSVRTVDGRSWVEQLEQHTVFGPIDFIRYQAGKSLIMRTIGHPQFDAAGTFTGYCGIAFELPADVEPQIDERRGSDRRRLARAAEILMEGDTSAISCVLIDVSETGARLRLPDDVVVADRFRLIVAAMAIDSMCDVRWRRAGEIGVKFVS